MHNFIEMFDPNILKNGIVPAYQGVSGLKYIGTMDELPTEANVGDVCITSNDNIEYVCATVDSQWIEIGPINATISMDTYREEKLILSVCECCGAP